jgi:hypothetical protein
LVTQVGEVTLLTWEENLSLGIALAEAADTPREWPALGRVDLDSIRLILASDEERFRRVSRGRAPGWGIGLAFPGSGTIVLRADDPSVFATLQHELAHLALHQLVSGRVPLWFDEGFAGWASGEFDRLDAWGLNLVVIRRRVPNLDELDAALRGSRATAETSYALAMTAVMELARRNPTQTLEPMVNRLAREEQFDEALVATTGFTRDGFEIAWQKSVKRRYSVLTWFAAGGMWLLVGSAVIWAYWARRRRDVPRRAALDRGWDVPEWQEEVVSGPDDETNVPNHGQSDQS